MNTKLTEKARNILSILEWSPYQNQEFTARQIDALCDGRSLRDHGIDDQEAVEESYFFLKEISCKEETTDFETIMCVCGESFTKIDLGDVSCPHCGQIWGCN